VIFSNNENDELSFSFVKKIEMLMVTVGGFREDDR
jgi:hypothetical protein